MASRSDVPQRSSRRWLIADGGYVLIEGSRMVGGPYPEIALVYGPAPKMAVRPRGRPRTRTRPHESLDAAISLMARGAGEPPPALGATVLLMTAPRDAAVQFAADVISQLQAEGHQDAAERVMVAAGAFDPSVVNAALLSPNHARAFLSDWQAGRTRLLGMSDADPDDAGSDASPAAAAPGRR